MRRVRRGILAGATYPRIGLMRSRALIVIGTVMYVVAWFLPTLTYYGVFPDWPFPGNVISGLSAFLFALTTFQPPWYATVFRVASALSNVVVVGALALVFIARRSPPRVLRAMLVASAVLNTQWFGTEGLRIGYYLWASSFFVITAGLILEGRDEADRAEPPNDPARRTRRRAP